MINNRLYDLRKSFSYAMSGIAFCVRYEKNMRIHITVMLYVLFFSQFYELQRSEIILLVLICVLVISLEMINTAIEVVVDKVSPNYHTLAKIAKDVAAGAVLAASLASVFIGLLLFWDIERFILIFDILTSRLSNISLLAASLIFSVIFISSGKSRRSKTPNNITKNNIE